MAELLILAGNTATSDAFAWKQGHVIDVKEDGHAWGDQECLPKFWIVKVPGVAAAQFAQYLAPKLDANYNITGIRSYILNVASAAAAALISALTATGASNVASAAAMAGYMTAD